MSTQTQRFRRSPGAKIWRRKGPQVGPKQTCPDCRRLMRESAFRMRQSISSAWFMIHRHAAIRHRDNKFCEHNT
jgi:hypothetical protein